jgi:hypothetical protein
MPPPRPRTVRARTSPRSALAADLADRFAGYDRFWVVGLRLTASRQRSGMSTCRAARGRGRAVRRGQLPEDRPRQYGRATRNARVVTEQLVAALLRGLSADKHHLSGERCSDSRFPAASEHFGEPLVSGCASHTADLPSTMLEHVLGLAQLDNTQPYLATGPMASKTARTSRLPAGCANSGRGG